MQDKKEMLDFSGRTQLYFQLYDILLKEITNGKYKAGELLPTENDLIEQYGISRVTVRKAMDLLQQDGLIVKKRGYGTYVCPKKMEQNMKKVMHFSEEMEQRGVKSSTKMISNEMIPACQQIAEALQIPEGTPLIRVARLRYANDKPLRLEIAHLVYSQCPDVYGKDFSSISLRKMLQSQYDITWSNATQRIYAVNAEEKIAGLLQVQENSALIYIERISFLKNTQPGEYLQCYYRGDSYYLTTELLA